MEESHDNHNDVNDITIQNENFSVLKFSTALVVRTYIEFSHINILFCEETNTLSDKDWMESWR